jgi:hypothetical protein
MTAKTVKTSKTKPCQVTYCPNCPFVGELTGLVHLPETPWDQRGTWWLDCLVTYETNPPRTEGLVLPVFLPDRSVNVFHEAGRLLGNLCVTAAVVCQVRPPMPIETIMAVQESNAKLVKFRAATRSLPDGTKILRHGPPRSPQELSIQVGELEL